MKDKLESILEEYKKSISQADSLKELDEIFIKLFGRHGEITVIPKEFSKLDKTEVKVVAPVFMRVKAELEGLIEKRRQEVREKRYQKVLKEEFSLDQVDKAQIKKREGHLHPITAFEDRIAEAFATLGFSQYDSPQIDSDKYNFELLNIPQEHPARDLWDTLYVEGLDSIAALQNDTQGPNPEKLLLRTHTSNSQVRIMEENKAPFRKMIIGRCFRYESVDARHDHTFEQFEIVYVDKGLSLAHLQFLSEFFLKTLFGVEIKARLKPKYFPFVEPGAGVDGLCIFCKGKGCHVCGGVGWLELAGAGMVHPTVLKNGGIDPEEYSGIAWGFGPGRMAMIKHGINDLRLFNSGDLRFLEKFDEKGEKVR